jgi:DNA modification methylase
MKLLVGDCRKELATLPDKSIHCCVTSPPYFGLRSYGIGAENGEIGQEETPGDYVAGLVEVFREVWRVLRDDGTIWLNLGDSYNGSGKGPAGKTSQLGGVVENAQAMNRITMVEGLKPKNLIGIPWRAAFALQGFAVVPFHSFSAWADELKNARESGDWRLVEAMEGKLRTMDVLSALQANGFYLRQDIIWSKTNCMPESVVDRCCKSHEYMFLLSKSARYHFDSEAIKEKQTESTRERAAYGWNGRTEDNSNGARTGTTFKRMAESGEPIGTIPADGMRNKRSVWTVATQPYSGAHFACFPPKLIEPCLLAGCPPKVCAVCGAPWERIVERVAATSKKCPKTDSIYQAQGGNGDKRTGTIGMSGGGRVDGSSRTIGHRPTCDCGGATQPGTVLDPFSGAGTTGLVALQQGRNYVGCELNPEYAEMSKVRLRAATAQGVLNL